MIPGTRVNPQTGTLEWRHHPAGVCVLMAPGRVGIVVTGTNTDDGTETFTWWADTLTALRIAHAITHQQREVRLGDQNIVVEVSPEPNGAALTLNVGDSERFVNTLVNEQDRRSLGDALFNAVVVANDPLGSDDPAWQAVREGLAEVRHAMGFLGLRTAYLHALVEWLDDPLAAGHHGWAAA